MTDNRITNPLTIVGGQGKPLHGTGCAMQVVSYTNGDAVITDYPTCSHAALSKPVQTVNDKLGIRGDLRVIQGRYYKALRPADAMTAVELGFATVGTADDGDDVLEAWLEDARARGLHLLRSASERWHIYGTVLMSFDHLVDVAGQLIDRWHELAGRGTPARAPEMAEASL